MPTWACLRSNIHPTFPHLWEQTTVEFTVGCIGSYNPEEELVALG